MDFIIRCSDKNGSKDFKVHRTMITLFGHFKGCLESGIRECVDGVLNLPEPPNVVSILMDRIYDINQDSREEKVDDLDWSCLLWLFGAGDK